MRIYVDANTKNVAIEKSLHYLLSPGSKGQSKRWLPTMKASASTVYKYVKYSCKIELELEKRATFCKEKNFKEHPLVFGVAESEDSVEEFVVAVGNLRYKFTDYLRALDTTFKIYNFFGIKFPPESRKVWLIINALFYDIETEEVIDGKLKKIIQVLLK